MAIEPITNIVALLMIVSAVAIVVRWIRLPYSIVLVLTGFGLSFFDVYHGFELTPALLFTIFLPALLFEGAINLNVQLVRRYRKSIAIFSVLGTVLTMILVGGLMHYLLGIPASIAFLFGALIAPTDPISVISIFREMRVSKRLTTIIEGESLFNDGVGIVVFKVLLGLVAADTLSVTNGIYQFVLYSAGGICVGFLVGYLFSRLAEKIDDHLVEITLTTVVAYGSYVLADALGISGVMAVVSAGLVISQQSAKIFKPTEQISVMDFWNYVTFILNSIIFLLIGLVMKATTLSQYMMPIAIAIGVVFIGRAVVIALLSRVINRVSRPLPGAWQTILIVGGVHGSLSMVLALSLPATIPQRELILALTYGVVLFSIVVQGLSIGPLIKTLKLSQKRTHEEYETQVAQLLANRAAAVELDNLFRRGLVTRDVYREARKSIETITESTEQRVRDLLKEYPSLKAEQLHVVQSVTLDASKNAVRQAYASDLISEEIMRKLIAQIDERIEQHRRGHTDEEEDSDTV